MVKQVGGTNSTFGEQILSKKPTRPKYSFGTSGRTEKIYDKEFTSRNFGKTSPGCAYETPSSLGPQQLSKRSNAPSHKFGNRYSSDVNFKKENRPGPGIYDSHQSLGKQTQSHRLNTPTWKFGTSERWSQYNQTFKGQYKTPPATTSKHPSGDLGDAPAFTFHGKGKRADVGVGLPGSKPTFIEDPGPGTYSKTSAFGAQADARKASMPRTRVGTGERINGNKQYLSVAHERALYGLHSPSPNLYNPAKSIGQQVNSRKQSSPNMKFGTSDRFSDVKHPPTKKGTPGPGSYVV
ncbi:hypothetical protein BSKO_08534 [Bryopsis sp. KO-2023]|nr:hypothetical protein BSKO_08534 [Bryopsis sp. KO-2023]